MKTLCPAFFCVWCACAAIAADPAPSISSPQLDIPTPGIIKVQIGKPPQVDLFVTDPPSTARQTWSGPLGKEDVGRRTAEGVSVSTSVPGTYQFRCVVQVPLPDFDDLEILDVTVVVEQGHGPQPPPNPPGPNPPNPPSPTGLTKLTADAVRSVQTDADKITFGIIGGIYGTVAQEIESGKHSTVDSVAKRLAELKSQSAALPILWSPASYVKWERIAKDVIGPELDRQADAGGLQAPADYVRPFREISAGIMSATFESAMEALN